jgi:hypothetical protein
MLGKVYIVLDFDNEEQKQYVQKVFEDISNMRIVSGRQIEQIYPFYQRHKGEINELFNMVSNGGAKSIMSMRGAALIAKLSKG